MCVCGGGGSRCAHRYEFPTSLPQPTHPLPQEHHTKQITPPARNQPVRHSCDMLRVRHVFQPCSPHPLPGGHAPWLQQLQPALADCSRHQPPPWLCRCGAACHRWHTARPFPAPAISAAGAAGEHAAMLAALTAAASVRGRSMAAHGAGGASAQVVCARIAMALHCMLLRCQLRKANAQG